MTSSPERRAVLVTRPEPGAGETAARLRARGFVPILAPMLEIRPIIGTPVPAADAILLTSRNGLLGLGRIARPVFAVGAATAAAARGQGAAEVASADGDSVALARLVRSRLPPGSSLLLPTARGQGEALAAVLRDAGYRVHLHPAYAVQPAARLPAAAEAALAGHRIAAALFFSAATARAFVAAVAAADLNAVTATVSACAIGPGVAVALERLVWRRVSVAAHPNQDALLALLE